MKKLGLLLLIGLLCTSLSSLAGELITNDTGEDATGLRVVFSAPVEIAAFGDILTHVDKEGPAVEFVFSGGAVGPWGSHWLNWSPPSAQIIGYEWLNRAPSIRTTLADDVAVVDHWRNDVFELVLPEDVGGEMVGTIIRRLSVEQIPFVVEYEIDLLLDQADVTWTSIQPDIEDEPEIRTGLAARFVYHSNRVDPEVSACFEIDGQEYEWTDPDIAFPLHNVTEIALDAASFHAAEDALSVLWSAANGDPDDALTFPITDPASPSAILISEWPNVLTIQCDITTQDDTTASEAIEALVYFRDGTPFEIRSVQTRIGPLSFYQIQEIIEQELVTLADLGVNSITHQTIWWFGPPNEDGSWEVHPIYSPIEWPWDERGNTPTLEILDYYLEQGTKADFQFHFELRQFPYKNDPQLHEDIWHKYYPYRSSDSFLYGDGEGGYLEQLRHYLPLFIEHGVSTVFLNAECGEFENLGGEKILQFFRDAISEYRNAGYTGAFSYATNLGADLLPFETVNLDPANCGIPWTDMDYVGLTYYPQLATTNDASTYVMYENAKRQVDEFIRPFSETYNKPVFIEDCYCEAFDGCAVDPLTNPSRELDIEESRRYHTAILRSFAEANIGVETPLIAGLTLGMYSFCPDEWLPGRPAEYGVAAPYLNVANGRRDLQMLMKVFYSDKPLLAPGQNGTEPRTVELERIAVIASLGNLTEPDWDLIPFVLEFPRDYAPDRYWYDGESMPISQSAHWDEPGHEIKRFGVEFESDGLSIHWEGYNDDLRHSAFGYWARFHYQQENKGTLFINVSPADDTVNLVLSTQDGWQALPTDTISYAISSRAITVHVPEMDLPADRTILELVDGAMEVHLVYPVSGGEFYRFYPRSGSSISYSDLVREQQIQPPATSTISVDNVASIPHTGETTFEIILPEEAGGETVGTITRTLSVEQIPFVVEYEIEMQMEPVDVTWTSIQPGIEDEPEIRTGLAARFVYLSNRVDPEVSACFEIDGQEYEWTDPDIAFPLHNVTEIALDAANLSPADDALSVLWSAANGDPVDAVTFPITDPTSPTATLISEWPNVLTVSCEITEPDGSIISEAIEALIYFKDGTPFETRGVAATIHDVYTTERLSDILDHMFPLLADLGVNSIVTAINWWFGPLNEDGSWSVYPIYSQRTEWPWDERGNTPTLEILDYYLTQGTKADFQFHFELRQFPYKNDPQLHEDIWHKYYPYRSSDSFLYGDGENGYLSQLQYYLPLFIEHGVESVFLNAEIDEFEELGGDKLRGFFRDVIAEYRGAGYVGALAYASNYAADSPKGYNWANLDPEQCGIPWSDMDYIGITYYPQLATTNDASTYVMYENAKRQVDEFIRPFSETYDKPVFVEDFYCFSYDGCAVNPLQNHSPDLELDLEEARRYHTAVLRSFAEANIGVETPLIAGMTLGVHSMLPEYWVDGRIMNEPGAPDVHFGDASRDLQLLMKVFYSDKPLLALGQNEGQFGTTVRLSMMSMKDSTPAATGWAEYKPGSYIELGTSLHGIQEWDTHICSVDWRDGSVYSFDPSQASSQLLGTLSTCITDFEIESDLLWIANTAPAAEATGFLLSDLDQIGAIIPIPEQAGLDGINIFGIEKTSELLYLLTESQGEQRLVVVDGTTTEVVYDCPLAESVSEAVGLELFEERLYTFDWPRGRILELHTTEGIVEIIDVLNVWALIPSSDRASGGFRGFHIGNEGIYVTSIGSRADEKSRLHFLTYPTVE